MAKTKEYESFKAVFLSAADGDTFWLEVDLRFRIYTHFKYRIEDFDAPEDSKAKTKEEKAHGKKSTAHAIKLLSGKKLILLSYKGQADKFGRFLAKIKLPDGRDFATEMIKAGMMKRGSYIVNDGV